MGPGKEIENSFDSWATSQWQVLVGLARVIAADPHLAEEVLQDAMVDLYSRWDRIRGFRNLLGYAARVMGSKVANRRRTAWARRVRVTDDLGLLDREASDAIVTSDSHLEVLGALHELNARQREVVAMHYLLDMPVAEVAQVLDRPVGSITSDLTRARKALREVLDEGGETR